MPRSIAESGRTDTASDHFGLDDFSSLSIDELLRQRGWQQRYKQLMRWANQVNAKPVIRREENLVQGCETDAWLSHREVDGRHQFAVDSDSRVVKGLAVLLLILINDKTQSDIAALDLSAEFAALGLEKHLSPSRSNGFKALVDRALELIQR